MDEWTVYTSKQVACTVNACVSLLCSKVYDSVKGPCIKQWAQQVLVADVALAGRQGGKKARFEQEHDLVSFLSLFAVRLCVDEGAALFGEEHAQV